MSPPLKAEDEKGVEDKIIPNCFNDFFRDINKSFPGDEEEEVRII